LLANKNMIFFHNNHLALNIISSQINKIGKILFFWWIQFLFLFSSHYIRAQKNKTRYFSASQHRWNRALPPIFFLFLVVLAALYYIHSKDKNYFTWLKSKKRKKHEKQSSKKYSVVTRWYFLCYIFFDYNLKANTKNGQLFLWLRGFSAEFSNDIFYSHKLESIELSNKKQGVGVNWLNCSNCDCLTLFIKIVTAPQKNHDWLDGRMFICRVCQAVVKKWQLVENLSSCQNICVRQLNIKVHFFYRDGQYLFAFYLPYIFMTSPHPTSPHP
jgi:hypothetical protein